MAACGGGSSSDANEATGTYKVRVAEAGFPTAQRLGQTSLLRIGILSLEKKRTIPALTITVSIAGKEGQTSSLPFGIHDPRPGLAQPDRPVWVLSAGYPKLAGSSAPGGATTSNPKTFAFGPLEPGQAKEAIWKLSAVKSGAYELEYEVAAGLGGAKTKTAGGVQPGGTFEVDISTELPQTEVNDSGEVVEIEKPKGRAR